MSADPIVQDASDSQAFNRYAYAGNNPFSYTDPSGYSWLSKIFKIVIVIVAVILMQYYVLPAMEGVAGGIGMSTAATEAVASAGFAAVNAGIAGAVGGYIATGTVKGAVIGGLTAAAFYEVGTLKGEWGIDTSTTGGALESAGLRGAVGCASSMAGGGNCGSGFLAAGFSGLAGMASNVASNDNFGGLVANTAQRAVVGGFGSVLGGGKFENGAVSGAFGYLFNDVLSHSGRQAACAVAGAAAAASCLGTAVAVAACPETGVTCLAVPPTAGACSAGIAAATGICLSGNAMSNPDRPSDRAIRDQCRQECSKILERPADPKRRDGNEWDFHQCVNDCVQRKKEYWDE